ncbi:uncharacterized protein LOC114333462 isoform X2 [Diabrotica virgifera virgifera]|nr:uncharacterized protein LOC114333462 isoform X2 [Diabrotica virgifera virgifera]
MAYNNVPHFCKIQPLTGGEDDRGSIRREFSQFGEIKKIYIDPEGRYGKVYLENNTCTIAAVNALRNNSYGWRVTLAEENRRKPEINDTSSNPAMDDVYVSESEELYTVHGKMIPTFEADNNCIFVSVDDVRNAGFGLLTRAELNFITSKRKVVLDDFYQSLLNHACSYLMKNKQLAAVITEDTISSIIERCKQTLIGDNAGNNNRNEGSFHQSSDSFRSPRPPNQRHSMGGGGQYGKRDNFSENNDNEASGSTRPAHRYSMESGKQDFKNKRSQPRDTERRYDQRDQKRDSGFRGKRDSDRSESGRRFENGNNSDRRSFNNNSGGNRFNRSQASRNEDNRASEANVEDEEEWGSSPKDSSDDIKIQSNTQMAKESTGNTAQKRIEQIKEKSVDSEDTNVKDKPLDSDKDIDVKDSNVKEKPVDSDKDSNFEVEKNNVEPEKKLNDSVKCFFELPKPIKALKDGDQVKIIDQANNQLIVKTKECFAKGKEIVEYIKNLDKDTLLLNEVKEGQMIICAKDGAPNLCRAVVLKVDSPTIATVTYLDYPGEEKLAIKSLRNVDDYLAKEPICLLFTPEIKVLESLSDVSLNYIQTLIEQKSKVSVVLSDDDFDLKMEDGSCLSTKLLELEKPKCENKQIESSAKEVKAAIVKEDQPTPATEIKATTVKENQPTPAKEPSEQKSQTDANVKVMFGEIDSVKPKIGSSGKYVCSNFKEDELTLISMEEDVLTEFSQLNDWLQQFDNATPYDPEAGEMCLVLHKTDETEEASWFRGVVLSNDENNYEISSVDCGNLITATRANIRSFPAALKNIRMLGIFCELVDIPDIPGAKDKLKSLIGEGTQLDATFKSYDEETTIYQVVVPDIYAKLKK